METKHLTTARKLQCNLSCPWRIGSDSSSHEVGYREQYNSQISATLPPFTTYHNFLQSDDLKRKKKKLSLLYKEYCMIWWHHPKINGCNSTAHFTTEKWFESKPSKWTELQAMHLAVCSSRNKRWPEIQIFTEWWVWEFSCTISYSEEKRLEDC